MKIANWTLPDDRVLDMGYVVIGFFNEHTYTLTLPRYTTPLIGQRSSRDQRTDFDNAIRSAVRESLVPVSVHAGDIIQLTSGTYRMLVLTRNDRVVMTTYERKVILEPNTSEMSVLCRFALTAGERKIIGFTHGVRVGSKLSAKTRAFTLSCSAETEREVR